MNVLFYLLCIFALNLLVFVHELFHLLMAKLLKIRATEFAVGFGPTLIAFQKQQGRSPFHWFPTKANQKLDTRQMSYHIKLIPLGGYVLFGRTDKQDGKLVVEDYLYEHPPWKRILVAAAGPFGNLLFAFVLAMILLSSYFSFHPNEVADVVPDSHAAALGIKKDDRLLSVNSQPVSNAKDIRDAIRDKEKVCVEWTHKTQKKEGCVDVNKTSDELRLGVNMGLSPIELPKQSFALVQNLTVKYTQLLGNTLLHLKVENLSGPVGIVDTMHSTITNIQHFLAILILINIALAIANLVMPFSLMDGGRIFLDVLAILFRKQRIPSKYLDAASALLMILLFTLTLYLDITRLFQ